MLETERLRMLPWRPDDWLDFRPIATDPEVMRYITGGQPWSDEQVQEWVNRQTRHFDEHGFCCWKLVEKGGQQILGFCGIQPIELDGEAGVEIGWWLAKAHWGRGLATEAARRALADAFYRVGLARIIAIAHPDNRASRRIMEKLGMHYQRDTVRRGFPVVLYTIERAERANFTEDTG